MLQRRQLLLGLGQAGLAAFTGLGANAANAAARPQDFDNATPRQPLLAPLRGVDDITGNRDAVAMLRGRWPAGLQGRFYRNGPALFERGGQRYHHWFDGDGMVQQFSIGDGAVRHRGRLVRTTKLQAEQSAGRFLLPTLGTHIAGGPPISGPDAVNAANTNALEHAGRVLAMWEGGSAYALNPADLSTEGPVTWRKDLAQVPFSAHPKVDPAGHLWNIGTAGHRLVVWHISPEGRLVNVQAGELPLPASLRGTMVHDMAITARYLVVPLPPVAVDFMQVPADGRRRFKLAAGEPLRLLVMEKADITKRRVFELPAEMVFHVGNAFETADGEITFSFIGAPDASFLDEGAVAMMAGRAAPQVSECGLRLVRLHMDTGRVQLQQIKGDVEFPRVHPQRIGQPARWLLTAAAWPLYPARQGLGRLHGVQLLDTRTGRTQRHDYGEHVVAEEHVLVPKPGKAGELDAWLLGTTYDARRQATVLNLLDAAHIADGPIAQAVLPYGLPLGFHGNFTAA